MHIVALIVITGIILYLIVNKNSGSQDQNQPTQDSDSNSNSGGELAYQVQANNPDCYQAPLAWLSKGKLFIRKGNGEVVQIHSDYIQALMDRMQRNKKKHAWKKNTSFDTNIGNQFGRKSEGEDSVSIHFSAAQFDNGKLIYFLKDFDFGGLFEYDFDKQLETRLIHSQNLLLNDLILHPNGDALLCSQLAEAGISNIAKMNKDGSDLLELTEGDTLDTSPCWVPGADDTIVFQSSGIARSTDGYVAAYGPASLQMLNLVTNELSTVLENSKLDFMQPRVCPEGNLYYIRRPFVLPSYSSSSMVGDILMFPFRLLRAVFHYLNFFSMMYTRKPLTSASGPKFEADLKDMMVKGMRIDAEKALRKEGTVHGIPSLVPKSWQLVCRNQQGQEKLIATHVAGFVIDKDGSVLYTNGCGVFKLTDQNKVEIVLKEKLISEIFV